ncbi:hypothetical protein DPMN_047143 [Dreissena polymorpha]|uniref:Uncharacterized protein n=1 Tax=Dreissena polymorpha TaxID=45954 RepID=A0A9D4I1K8_DREPO|nr:hypothetical protein DPMN_047143 [Dreissena polymorpha]
MHCLFTCGGFDPHCGSVVSPQQTPSTGYTQEADLSWVRSPLWERHLPTTDTKH